MVKRAPKSAHRLHRPQKPPIDSRRRKLEKASLMRTLREAHVKLETLMQTARVGNESGANDSSREILIVDALIPYYLALVRKEIDKLPKRAIDEIGWALSIRARSYLATTHYFTDPEMRAAQIAAKTEIARTLHSRVKSLIQGERSLPAELTSFDTLHETVIREIASITDGC